MVTHYTYFETKDITEFRGKAWRMGRSGSTLHNLYFDVECHTQSVSLVANQESI